MIDGREDDELAPFSGHRLVERALIRGGVSNSTARLLGATPSLHLSWFGSAAGALVFAVVAAHAGPRSALLFLVLAPLLPLAGVALAYGPEVDPVYEVSRAAPTPASRLLFIRATAVIASTLVLGAVAALALPQLDWTAAAWLLPSLALTVSSLALSTFVTPLRAAAIVCALWLGGLIAAAIWARSALVVFRGPAQVGFFGLTFAASLILVRRRDHLDMERRERQRDLVVAQESARRRLERDLHDGAQQQLVAIAVKLGLAKAIVGRDPIKLESLLQGLQDDVHDALDSLRELARGTHPPVLVDRGLVPALEARATRSTVPTTVQASGVGRYPPEVEVAVYFCCLEAVQNAAKYAQAAAVRIRLDDAAGVLRFSVADDGVGFDTKRTEAGSGMRNMEQRLVALGGSVDVRSRPGAGTIVSGVVPWRTIADALDGPTAEPLSVLSPTGSIKERSAPA